MDIELQESVDKFRQLTGLAHFCYGSPKHKFNTQQEKIANQLFLKICLSLDSIDKILPQENQLPLLNISSLWIFARVLMEEQITFSYLFNQTLTAEEKDFRFDLYLYHGVVEDYDLLKKASTENFNDDENIRAERIKVFEKCNKEIERCKREIENNPFIKKIPKDKDKYYRTTEIVAGKYPKYIKLDKLFIDEYSNGPRTIFLKWIQALISRNNQSIGYPQIYAAYKLGSSYIHSSSLALHKLFIFEQNLKEQNYSELKIVMSFIRMCSGISIKLYTEVFNISISEKDLGNLAF